MSRLQADGLLLLAALIWGFAFAAQKSAMDAVGPFTFVAARFFLSALVVLPFMLRERKQAASPLTGTDKLWLLGLGGAFFAGVALQQVGMLTTTVTNSGFLTSLYVVMTPLVSLLLFRTVPNAVVWLAAPLCVAGVWMLGNGSVSALGAGDLLTIGCAFFFALHIVMIGIILTRTRRPFAIMTAQYAICAGLALACALATEEISTAALYAVLPQILYAGIISGGIAYSLQVIGQQHTPPSDAAVILSAEALFAALGGYLLMGDRLTPLAWGGCAAIFAAILLVELFPLIKNRLAVKPR